MHKDTALNPPKNPGSGRSTETPQVTPINPAHPTLATRRVPHRDPGPPAPVEALALSLPGLPTGLEGLRILHLTDLHVRRRRRGGVGGAGAWERLIAAVSQVTPDLVVYTGDYMDAPGHEAVALDALGQLTRAVAATKPRLGQWGVFGNHDTPAFRTAAMH